MTSVRPAPGPEPAQWLFSPLGLRRPEVDWWDLVRYGPPGFDGYVRVLLNPWPDIEPEGELPGLRLALEVLAAHTSTPETAFAAIWDGWTSRHSAPAAPLVPIPQRDMLLFTGPVELLRDAPALAWQVEGTIFHEPNLVWPEDRAWCLACEVDEEIEFSVGCTGAAASALVNSLPTSSVRRVEYGEDAPLYRPSDG